LFHEYKCTTQIFYNYVVFHPETNQVVIVGSKCNQRWNGDGKLLKMCQACERAYSGKIKFCRACQPSERRRIGAAASALEERGGSKISFGQRHRGRTFAEVYGTDKGYVD
jgi:hypothetical protein